MARIRTVKPDFWTDEKVVECSFEARLLFIGLFNFADDNGNMVNSHRRIKMQIFPADVIDCKPLIDELIKHGLVISYEFNGINYLNIKGFKKHQYIKKPSKTIIPELSSDATSSAPVPHQYPTSGGGVCHGREGKGYGKGSKPPL